ncbi:hypothetical protein ACOME3_002573 [Neoechinorhynchus agilis]
MSTNIALYHLSVIFPYNCLIANAVSRDVDHVLNLLSKQLLRTVYGEDKNEIRRGFSCPSTLPSRDLYIASSASSIQVFNFTESVLVKSIDVSKSEAGEPLCFCSQYYNNRVAVGFSNSIVKIYDQVDMLCKSSINLKGAGNVLQLSMSCSETFLAYCENGKLYEFSAVKTNPKIKSITDLGSSLYCIRKSTYDCYKVVGISSDQQAFVITEYSIFFIKLKADNRATCCCNINAFIAVGYDDGSIRIFANTLRLSSNPIQEIAYCEKSLIVDFGDGDMRIFKVKSDEGKLSIVANSECRVRNLIPDVPSRILNSSIDEEIVFILSNESQMIYYVELGEDPAMKGCYDARKIKSARSHIFVGEMDSDGTAMLFLSEDGKIVLYDEPDMRNNYRTIRPHGGECTDFALLSNDNIVCCGAEGKVSLTPIPREFLQNDIKCMDVCRCKKFMLTVNSHHVLTKWKCDANGRLTEDKSETALFDHPHCVYGFHYAYCHNNYFHFPGRALRKTIITSGSDKIDTYQYGSEHKQIMLNKNLYVELSRQSDGKISMDVISEDIDTVEHAVDLAEWPVWFTILFYPNNEFLAIVVTTDQNLLYYRFTMDEILNEDQQAISFDRCLNLLYVDPNLKLRVLHAFFSNDESQELAHIAIGSSSGKVFVIDIYNKKTIVKAKLSNCAITAIHYDEPNLYVGCEDHSISVISVLNPQKIFERYVIADVPLCINTILGKRLAVLTDRGQVFVQQSVSLIKNLTLK